MSGLLTKPSENDPQKKHENFLRAIPEVEQNRFLKMMSLLGKSATKVPGIRVLLPTIYYWEDKENGTITASFRWKKQIFGMSYPYDDNFVKRNNFHKRKLIGLVKDTMDVLIHHGAQVLDSNGNIDSSKVHDAEAQRFRYDRLWSARVAAFEKAVMIKTISKEQAIKLHLL